LGSRLFGEIDQWARYPLAICLPPTSSAAAVSSLLHRHQLQVAPWGSFIFLGLGGVAEIVGRICRSRAMATHHEHVIPDRSDVEPRWRGAWELSDEHLGRRSKPSVWWQVKGIDKSLREDGEGLD
jgi:hypothetical protein